jgi:sucrose-6-phosphate hydrolase SacC (GH32 family)
MQPPFELKEGEDLTLRIFIDKNMIEAFANNRQAAVGGMTMMPMTFTSVCSAREET